MVSRKNRHQACGYDGFDIVLGISLTNQIGSKTGYSDTGIDYLSVAAHDDLDSAHIEFLKTRVSQSVHISSKMYSYVIRIKIH